MSNVIERTLWLKNTFEKKMRGLEYYIIGESEKSILTRFSNSSVHQNMLRENMGFFIFITDGERFTTTELNSMEKEMIESKIDDSLESLHLMPKAGFRITLSESGEFHDDKFFDEESSIETPNKVAEMIGKIFKFVNEGAYGALSVKDLSFTVVNSKGLKKYIRFSPIELNLVIMKGNGSSQSSWGGWKLSELEKVLENLVENTVKTAEKAQDPEEIELGEYGVILSPKAVLDIVEYVAQLLCNGKLYEDKLSASVKLLGERIAPEYLNILDDPYDEDIIPIKFDFAGTSREKFYLIENGKLVGLMYNFLSALKYNKKPTGHTLSLSELDYAFPMNPVFKGGRRSINDILNNSDGYIYISRFHYTNVVNPIETIVTGLTRDGTFVIKDGKFEKSVKNMRFNFSILDLFKNIEDVSTETEIIPFADGYFLAKMPYLKIRKFRFTSS